MPDEFVDTFDAAETPEEQPTGDALDDPPPVADPTKGEPVVSEPAAPEMVIEPVAEEQSIPVAEVPSEPEPTVPLLTWIVKHATHGKATVRACDAEGAKDAFCAVKGKPRAEVEAVYPLLVVPFVPAATEIGK